MPNLTEILSDLHEGFEEDKITMGEIVAHFEDRGFGPLLLVPALIAVLPTGAIPGVPAVCAALIILICGQLLFGKHHPWLPKKIREFSFSKSKFESGFEKVKPWTKRFDKLLKPRLQFLTRDTGTRIVALISIALALLMIPLELIPLACAIPGVSIACFAIGLSAKDGLFSLLALIVAGFSAWAGFHFWGEISESVSGWLP
ncbi:MAG: exopolysaccharide biosynthesis protein [Verrucomicrobiales bacterium]|nr:exopolysaccharide biosynthesis protein [Verrucomicrobiales bacterium]